MKTILAAPLATALILAFMSVESAPTLSITEVKASTQESSTLKRTHEIVAFFSKRKHMIKEKFGVRKERYKEIRSELVVKIDPKAYSGTYEVADLGFAIQIQVRTDGKVEASGYEPQSAGAQGRRKFTLMDAKIDGALLSATKVYEDGTADELEGVFINQTEMEGVSPEQIEHSATAFGLGVSEQRVEIADGVTLDKLFYRFRP